MISVDRSHLSVCTYVNVCVCLLHRHGFNQHFSVKKGDEGSNSPWNPLVCHEKTIFTVLKRWMFIPNMGKTPWKNIVISSIPSHLICQTRWKNNAILEDLSKKKFPAPQHVDVSFGGVHLFHVLLVISG